MTRDGASVRRLLDTPLREPRVYSLEAETARVAELELETVVTDLRATLEQPVTGEDCRRLHVLLSTLYHRRGAPLELTEELRAAIETARTREEVTRCPVPT